MVTYQSNQVVGAPSGTQQTWGCTAYVLPNPVGLAQIALDDDNGTTTRTTVINPQLAGDVSEQQTAATTFKNAVTALHGQFERWRLAFAGVTVYLDAPALADQGTCVAAQYPLVSTEIGGGYFWKSQDGDPGVYSLTSAPLRQYQDRDFPTFSELQVMPNAYSGVAKEGCYMPLILDSNHSVWHSPSDEYIEFPAAQYNQATTGVVTLSPVAHESYAYPGTIPLQLVAGGGMDTGANRIPAMCTDIAGAIAFRNLSVGAKLTFVYRFGFECMTQPASIMAPFQKMSPAYDMQAVNAYYQLRREMKDAYPADYNDLQKIWGVIKDAASVLGSALPAPVKAVGGLIGRGIDKGIEKWGKKTNPRDKAPAAAAERTVEVTKRMMEGGKTKPRRALRASR